MRGEEISNNRVTDQKSRKIEEFDCAAGSTPKLFLSQSRCDLSPLPQQNTCTYCSKPAVGMYPRVRIKRTRIISCLHGSNRRSRGEKERERNVVSYTQKINHHLDSNKAYNLQVTFSNTRPSKFLPLIIGPCRGPEAEPLASQPVYSGPT